MQPSIAGLVLKVERACEQIDALHRDVAAFLSGTPFEPKISVTRLHGVTPHRFVFGFRITMSVAKQFPPMWPIVIGEILHDLRSSLDHCVYELAIRDTSAAPAEEDRTQFPILIAPPRGGFDSLRMLAGLSGATKAFIETWQPYKTGEGDLSPLWHLSRLSNIDKHRMLHLTGATMQAFEFGFPPLAASAYIERTVMDGGAFRDGTTVAEGRIYSDEPPFGVGELKVNATINFDVIFDRRTTAFADGEWSVVGTLQAIANRTADVLEVTTGNMFGIDVAFARPKSSLDW